MVALLIVALCSLALAVVLLNAFFLWLSCKICRVARPSAEPGGKPRGVGYGRALLCAVGLAVIGYAMGAAFFSLSFLFSGIITQTPPNFLLIGVAEFVLGLIVSVVFLRFTLPTSLGRSLLVLLLWDVFSVVLVVGLFFGVKAAVFDAFVFPTGSMAETVLGYHKEVVCPQCGYQFAVNCSQQVDPQTPPPTWVSGCTCPNCRRRIAFAPSNRPAVPDAIPDPEPISGDRLLTGTGLFGPAFFPPRRMDLIVFQYPVDPSDPRAPSAPIMYLKRLIGLPGETVAIHGGDLYVLPPDKGPHYDQGTVNPADLWQRRYMHADDPAALENFKNGAFEVLRRSPDLILAMRRIVYDNDHPAKDAAKPRWADRDGDAAWKADGGGFRLTAPADAAVHWLGYRHLLPDAPDKPQLVTDFMGYNTAEPTDRVSGVNWVGDLVLECDVQTDAVQGELTLELSKGVDRFRARFDLASGDCSLFRVQDGQEEKLDVKPAGLKAGSHHVRFANVDERLTVWVDDSLPFGDGVTYKPPEKEGPTENDLQPASVGVRGVGATVHGLKLWRDVYYTVAPRGDPGAPDAGGTVDFGDPKSWDALRQLPTLTDYVQPDCFFVLGDNSPQSSDSRLWGLVPRRLLLGKAFLVYYPWDRAGWTH